MACMAECHTLLKHVGDHHDYKKVNTNCNLFAKIAAITATLKHAW